MNEIRDDMYYVSRIGQHINAIRIYLAEINKTLGKLSDVLAAWPTRDEAPCGTVSFR